MLPYKHDSWMMRPGQEGVALERRLGGGLDDEAWGEVWAK